MKIGVISDLHGNLPALQVILEKFETEQCDRIYCLGDTLAIGPYSKECIEILLKLPNIKFVMGNHEEYFIKGTSISPKMSEGERLHQHFIARSLTNEIKEHIKVFPYIIEEQINGIKVAFMHYARDQKNEFKPLLKNITKESLDDLFKEVQADIIFYGHDHKPSNITSEKHYINVGSSGCTKTDVTHCTMVELYEQNYKVEVIHLNYDKETLIHELIQRDVPEKEFIMKVFY